MLNRKKEVKLFYKIRKCHCGKLVVCKNLVNKCSCGNTYNFYGRNTYDYKFMDPFEDIDGRYVYYGEGILEY